jgi:hypothetical protein
MTKLFRCESCCEVFNEKDLKPAADIEKRIDVGEPFTPYECPVPGCGALCHPLEEAERLTCETEGCEKDACVKVGVSEFAPNDSFRFLCGVCEMAYRTGSQHGRMIFRIAGEHGPDPDPPLTRINKP